MSDKTRSLNEVAYDLANQMAASDYYNVINISGKSADWMKDFYVAKEKNRRRIVELQIELRSAKEQPNE